MRRRGALLVMGGLVLAAALAVVSPWASSSPDGLETVAAQEGFADGGRDHPLDRLPTAGYSLDGVGDQRLATALSGLVGVAVTFALAVAVAAWIRTIASRRSAPPGVESG